jgi:hypothetical protein
MKSIHIVPFLFIFLVATAFGANDEGIASNVKVPKTVTFLPMPVGSRVRVVTGVLEELGAGGYAASNLPVSIQMLLNTGKPVEMILGTPALVNDYTEIDARRINNNNRVPTAAAVINDGIVAVLENRVRGGTGVETHFSVFARDGDFHKVSEFRLRDNLYNLYLSQAYAVSPTLLAIVLTASRNPYVKALLFFDVRLGKPVGYSEFSRMQYLPDRQSIWMAEEVPNCDNLAEALQDAEKRASVIPILKNGKLNSAFSETEELVEVYGN